jgi:hypothetical protein
VAENIDGLMKALDAQEVELTARQRYTSSESYQSRLNIKYRKAHNLYAPIYGDQWPEDLTTRPGKIHMSVNIVKAAVDVDARIQSLMPRISLEAESISQEDRARAEAQEKMMLQFLEFSGWEVWFNDLTKVKCLYGKGILQPFWNKDENRPDVTVVENPANLRIGYGSSDYRMIDWTLYEHLLSPLAAMQKYPGIRIDRTNDKKNPFQLTRVYDHADPLNTAPLGNVAPLAGAISNKDFVRTPSQRVASAYERDQVRVWDYWYKDEKGDVYNAVLIEGKLVEDPKKHPELFDIPFIVIENDHEPASPEGVGTAEPIYDLQIELNRAISHWAQLVADEIDPSWQLTGENADSIPSGIVPKAGEIVAVGAGNKIEPIAKTVNQFPVQQLIEQIFNLFHRVTGLSEVLFGAPGGSQTSGRALAVQVEAAANRLDPKRRRLYRGLKELLVFWTFMAKKVNPKFVVEQNELGEKLYAGLSELFSENARWRIVAPEITPRDVIENTTNTINKVNSKLISLRTAMDELGVDSPEDEIKTIELERSNAHLFPGDVQAWVAVVSMIQQMQAQQQAMAQQLSQVTGTELPGQAGAPGAGMSQQAQAESAANQAQNDQFAMQPQGTQGDNAEAAAMPASAQGQPAPAGTNPTSTTLIRNTPTGGATTLQQTVIKR